MEKKNEEKFKRSYEDEYEALYEAVYGKEEQNDGIKDNYTDVPYTTCIKKDINPNYEDIDDERSINHIVLPDLVLEKIFELLTTQEKYYASLTCQNWYSGFYLPNSWRTFIFDDTTLTRRIFNYYSGWQYMLDHLRSQLCLNRIGRYIKKLIFKPIHNFYNLYEFMNMISFYAEQKDNKQCNIKKIGENIAMLHYTFPCNMSTSNETRLYGTGGKLLDALKRLMKNLPSLTRLELIDLMLDSEEAITFLDDMCYSHCLKMKTLILINLSKTQCQLLHLGAFLNLQVLVVSPQSLGEDVLYLISETKLRNLHIVQNSYTPSDITAIPTSIWNRCLFLNPNLQVHLTVESKDDATLLWQPCAPVSSVLFNSRFIKLGIETVTRATDLYSNTLKIFGNLSLPRFYQPKSFHERIDSFLIFLCNRCTSLEILIIREKISTATILLITHIAKKLRFLYIRRNSVILRSDWPKNPEWNDEFYAWLNHSSRSYDIVESEVSKILQYRWTMLSDKEFKRINPKLY